MWELKRPFLGGVLTLLFLLIRLGFSQITFDVEDSSKADENTVKFLRDFSERKGFRNITNHNFHKTTAQLHDIVQSRLRKEMAILFLSLPKQKKSKLLQTFSTATSCSVPIIIELLNKYAEWKINVSVSGSFEHSCHHKTSRVVGIVDHELLKMFERLPLPFKCHIISTISMVYNKERRNLSSSGLTYNETQNALQKIFPFVQLPQACADKDMDCLRSVPSIPSVNITVNLISGNREMWLQSLKTKGPIIYQTLLEYESEADHKDKVLGPSNTAPYLEKNKETINSAQLIIVDVFGDSKTFSISFRLKVKRKSSNHQRELKSTYKIVHALTAKKQQQLRDIFDANIVSISLSRQKSIKNKSTLTSNQWSFHQFNEGKELFPKELAKYFRQLAKLSRCSVICFISIKIKKTPKEVEMLYSSLRYLSRKHSCFYTQREVPTGSTINVTVERFTPKTSPIRIPTMNPEKVTPTKRNDQTVNGRPVTVFEDDSSVLEIALFILLGLLCIIILAFVTNCLVSSLKSKSPMQKNTSANDTTQTSVFIEGASGNTLGSDKNDGVHLINIIQGKGRESLNLSYHTDMSHGQICTNNRQPQDDKGTENISTNIRTHKENEYILDSSQLHVDKNAVEPLWRRRSSFKTACKKGNHSLVGIKLSDSQGEALRYCKVSAKTRAALQQRAQLSRKSLSEESQEVEVILAKHVGQEVKEVQV